MFDDSFASALNDFCKVVDDSMRNMRSAINEFLDEFDTDEEKRAAACVLVASLYASPPRGCVVEAENVDLEEV